MKTLLLILSFISTISFSQDSTKFDLKGLVTEKTALAFTDELVYNLRYTDRHQQFLKSPEELIEIIPDTMLTILDLQETKDWDFDPQIYKELFESYGKHWPSDLAYELHSCKMMYEGDQFYKNFNFGILFGNLQIKFFNIEDPEDMEIEKIEFIAFQISEDIRI